MARNGPTIGSARAPMIQAAGKDHVIFSKKLLMIIAAVIATSVFIFFVIEQSRANGNWAISREAMKQNADIKSSNMQLSDAREELQKEEDELVNLYSTWLDEDGQEIELSQEQLKQLKDQLAAIQDKVGSHSSSLKEKDAQLEEKERRLKSYQFKIQQKQTFIDEMAKMITTLNGTAPKMGVAIDQPVMDDLVWDDELAGDDDFYGDYYTGDDDWMNDAEWLNHG